MDPLQVATVLQGFADAKDFAYIATQPSEHATKVAQKSAVITLHCVYALAEYLLAVP